jgi:NADPH-dependent ferric siderophore reductase
VAIPPAGAPFALEELRSLPRGQRPFRRRNTDRRWKPGARRLTLEFVTHEDAGAAAPWAARAKPGDTLVFTGPAGAYRPDPAADWHLMVGDESALPAIAASLEAVAHGVPAVVRLVCDGPAHEIPLATHVRLDLAWLHRTGGPGDADLLADAVAAADFPAGRMPSCTARRARPGRCVGICSPTAAWSASRSPARRTGAAA